MSNTAYYEKPKSEADTKEMCVSTDIVALDSRMLESIVPA